MSMTKTTTVDASSRDATVGRTSGIAFRQCRNPTPLCMVEPEDMAPAIKSLISRISEIEKARNCGAYLFVDPKTRQAYVVSEERSIALVWVRERFGWLVGFYRLAKSKDHRYPMLKPTEDGLREDLADHLGLPA